MAITNITEALDALKTLAEGLPAAVTVDDTLSVEGAAADAKAVGEALGAEMFDFAAMGLPDLTLPNPTLTLSEEDHLRFISTIESSKKLIITYTVGTLLKIAVVDDIVQDPVENTFILSVYSNHIAVDLIYDISNATLTGSAYSFADHTHVENTSNPHNVTAAQVTTDSGKTVEEALEVPVLDLDAMGVTEYSQTSSFLMYGSYTLNDSDNEALFETAFNHDKVTFTGSVIPVLFVTTDVLMDKTMSYEDYIDSGESYFFNAVFCNAFGGGTYSIGIQHCPGNGFFVFAIHTVPDRGGSAPADYIGSGTFAGQVVANSTAQPPATMLLRNSKLVTTETNPAVNGEIVWQYG